MDLPIEPGHALFEDRSVTVAAGSGSPFRGLVMHKSFSYFAAYMPTLPLPPKERSIKIGGKTVQIMTLGVSYTDVYLTFTAPFQHQATWVQPTDLIVLYSGQARLSYTATSRIGGVLPAACVVEFSPVVWLQIRRSASESFEVIHIITPGGTQGAKLFPGSERPGVFYCPCSWPMAATGDVAIRHAGGRALSS